MKKWKKLGSKIVHKNPYWRVEDHKVIKPNGRQGHYYVLRNADGAIAIPLTNNKKDTYLIRQWRYPISKYSWECPMGAINNGEKPLLAVKRELFEETGLKAETWSKLNPKIYLSNGLTNQALHIYIAERLKDTGQPQRDGSEQDMIMKKYSLKQVYKMIESGKIHDSFTILAFFYLKNYLKI